MLAAAILQCRIGQCRSLHQQKRIVHRKPAARPHATNDTAYTARLAECERHGKWEEVIELMTEVRVLDVELPPEAYEAGLRTLAVGNQADYAAKLLGRLLEHKTSLDNQVIVEVFSSLSRNRCADAALALFTAHYEGRKDQPVYAPVYNAVVRACARGGKLDEALSMLDALVLDDEVQSEGRTFDVVAAECMFAGRQDAGLEVLEMRDYL